MLNLWLLEKDLNEAILPFSFESLDNLEIIKYQVDKICSTYKNLLLISSWHINDYIQNNNLFLDVSITESKNKKIHKITLSFKSF